MRKLALTVAIAAAAGLAACEKTGENEFRVQTPDIDVSTDSHTVRTPDVDIVTDTARVITPDIDIKKDTSAVKVPKVRVKRP